MATTIQLSPEADASLERLAARIGQSKSACLNRLIEEHLDDLMDACLAEAAWAEHLASGEPTVSLEQLEQDLGLER